MLGQEKELFLRPLASGRLLRIWRGTIPPINSRLPNLSIWRMGTEFQWRYSLSRKGIEQGVIVHPASLLRTLLGLGALNLSWASCRKF